MKPESIQSKIFGDSGDPDETRELISLLGFLDGQTTNPSLIAKNPEVKERLDSGDKFTREELLVFYKEVVKEVSGLIPAGSVSIEVYSDKDTKAEEMFEQGEEMFTWIPNAHVKYPTTREGLAAAERSVKEGMRVNMTLVFSQEQAAAVYAATQGAQKGDVFVSPFVGRLDDKGENGMGLIKNILEMYKEGDGHVEVLTASVRNSDHLLYALQLGSDIITSPFKVLKEWGEKGMPTPQDDYTYEVEDLKEIAKKDLDLKERWQEFDLHHELTDKGIERFSADWNALIKTP